MKTYFEIIKNNPLFEAIARSDFASMLDCLDAKEKSYHKNDFVVLAGDAFGFVGIVISGSVKIIREDASGTQTLVTEIFPGELFGETFACAGIYHSPVSVVAAQDCQILLMDYRKVLTVCKQTCMFHARLIENMLKIMAQKNLFLNQKIDILSKRTLREKLICYLDYTRNGALKCTLPFNREELANYLCADRSAISNEFSKMKKDGLITYSKREVEILYADF